MSQTIKASKHFFQNINRVQGFKVSINVKKYFGFCSMWQAMNIIAPIMNAMLCMTHCTLAFVKYHIVDKIQSIQILWFLWMIN